jgi:hypothetical protein
LAVSPRLVPELREEESLRIVALCEDVCREMEQQRQLFEEQFEQQLQVRREEFAACFHDLDRGLELDNHPPTKHTLALNQTNQVSHFHSLYTTYSSSTTSQKIRPTCDTAQRITLEANFLDKVLFCTVEKNFVK